MNLTEREQKVIELRKQGKTLEEIGKEFGVTRERIRQIESKALFKIKYAKRKEIEKKVKDFIEYIKENIEIRTDAYGNEDFYIKGTKNMWISFFEKELDYEIVMKILRG